MQSPPLADLLRTAIRAEIARVHTQAPARVVSYDPATQRAKVQLVISHAFEDPETGERKFYQPPPLADVPVIFPAILTWPIGKGDPGWVQFAERSTDEYVATGRDSDPADARRFDLSDATFYPTFLRGEADADGSAAVLASDDLRVRSSSTSVTRPVAIAPEVETFIRDLILTEIVPHIHSDPLTGTTGPSPGPWTPPGPGQFDSGNVEAE